MKENLPPGVNLVRPHVYELPLGYRPGMRVPGYIYADEDLIVTAGEDKAIEQVAKLPEKYRDVLMLRYVDDLSVAEISVIIAETENNVSVRIHRGLEKLKNILEKNGQ